MSCGHYEAFSTANGFAANEMSGPKTMSRASIRRPKALLATKRPFGPEASLPEHSEMSHNERQRVVLRHRVVQAC